MLLFFLLIIAYSGNLLEGISVILLYQNMIPSKKRRFSLKTTVIDQISETEYEKMLIKMTDSTKELNKLIHIESLFLKELDNYSFHNNHSDMTGVFNIVESNRPKYNSSNFCI